MPGVDPCTSSWDGGSRGGDHDPGGTGRVCGHRQASAGFHRSRQPKAMLDSRVTIGQADGEFAGRYGTSRVDSTREQREE